MKNLCLFGILIAQSLHAQPCLHPQANINIHSNNILASIRNDGQLFTDGYWGQFFPDPQHGVDNPTTIFKAVLLMAGLDSGGNLRYNGAVHENPLTTTATAFTAGPLQSDGSTTNQDCSNWDKLFHVSRIKIDAFRAAHPVTAADLNNQFPEIAGWPAKGNPYFASVWAFELPQNDQDLAPFVDADNDGIYDPLNGDYPAVALKGQAPFVPEEIIWCVFNDQKGGAQGAFPPFYVEVQLTVWAFHCSDIPALDNTIFTSHKIINRGLESFDSTYVGLWVDGDLGCPYDDFAGCNPVLSTMYMYNQDAIDGEPGSSCSGVAAVFSNSTPVQSVSILNRSLDGCAIYNNPFLDSLPAILPEPFYPHDYFNGLAGAWMDGTPFTMGGTGYNPGNTDYTKYLFSDDPVDPNGWSMCNINLPPNDRRLMGSIQVGKFVPGQAEEITTAWTVHHNPPLPCGLGATFDDVAAIRESFHNNFNSACTPLKAPDLPGDSVQLFPNPTADATLLHYGALTPLSLRVFDAAGRLVSEKTAAFEKMETRIQTAGLASGVYNVQLLAAEGITVKKLTVMR